MFRINIQKSDFLKGKFSLYCQNYNDALFYFIRAAKKRSIVIDGLIKKRSLKHINKILIKLGKKYENFGLMNKNMEKELNEYKRHKKKYNNKRMSINRKNINIIENINDSISFGEKIKIIKKNIMQDINECNTKEEKDIIILIDFNIYNTNENDLYKITDNIDLFIDETKIILNNYLSPKDRLSVLIYFDEYQIICPLMLVNKIDINSFENDLLYYKNNFYDKNDEAEEYDINSNEFNLSGKSNSEHSQEDSYELNDKEEKIFNKLKGLIKAVNYMINYLKMKKAVKNEKYIILFSDLINIRIKDDEQLKIILEKLNRNKDSVFLLIGKKEKTHLNQEKNNYTKKDKIFEELILNKFNEKSEVINFENMKKIKTILSNNNVIRDEIFYPNEIYK